MYVIDARKKPKKKQINQFFKQVCALINILDLDLTSPYF